MISAISRGLVCGFLTVAATLALLLAAPPAQAMEVELEPAEVAALKRDFAPCLSKLKGPYTENFCVCRKTGDKRPVRNAAGAITSPCGNDALFCAAFRAPWAEALAKHRVWIANIFSRDLYLWNDIPNHHDLVRGYILDQYFTDANPTHKLAELKAFRGLSGSEYEVVASMQFFERYLDKTDLPESLHFPLAYELQRRFFLHSDLGEVEKVRMMAVRIQSAQPSFKPIKDAIHNQLSASLVPKMRGWRDKQTGAQRKAADELLSELVRLVTVDESALTPQLGAISDAKVKAELGALLPDQATEPVAAIGSLARFMMRCRDIVASRAVGVADARRVIDLDITAGAVLQRRGSVLLESGAKLPIKANLELLSALTDGAYGAGLLVAREREAAQKSISELLGDPNPKRADFARGLKDAGRIVEWSQLNSLRPYAEVWPQWTLLMPQVALISDDIVRSSPLLLYAQVYGRLDDWAAGSGAKRHDFFGKEVTRDVRVLNPGLAAGRLEVAPKQGSWTRDDIIALPQTPADLTPAAGILTQGEGNVLSHVQLLARALSIPNVVLGPSAYALLAGKDNSSVFLAATPGGRVVLRDVAQMTEAERAVYAEFTKNDARRSQASLDVEVPKLKIDTKKIDLSKKLPISLDEIRRTDSGRICGPKGAFLGELKHLFPDKVARGIVVPFGSYRAHYDSARVIVPDTVGAGVANAGEPLARFVERTYATFFDEMIPAGKDSATLSAWIAPRLAVIRNTLQQTPLSDELRAAIRDGLAAAGLIRGTDRTVGCFVRSDTNVEDLDSFNGAGLNLTLFNMGSLEDIYTALRRVWASPFELRSFSWRQTLIDEPLWVLPSVVILESIPSDKSGVLVTCDIQTGDPTKMVIATSEGVGGAVDGTSAETLLWSPSGVEIQTLFKSAWRNELLADGGSRVAPSSGKDEVLSPAEIDELVAAGKAVTTALAPALDREGKPRPWDIEFGFSRGKLWLFQSRPFIGNESVKNLPALATLDAQKTRSVDGKDTSSASETVSLEDRI